MFEYGNQQILILLHFLVPLYSKAIVIIDEMVTYLKKKKAKLNFRHTLGA